MSVYTITTSAVSNGNIVSDVAPSSNTNWVQNGQTKSPLTSVVTDDQTFSANGEIDWNRFIATQTISSVDYV